MSGLRAVSAHVFRMDATADPLQASAAVVFKNERRERVGKIMFGGLGWQWCRS